MIPGSNPLQCQWDFILTVAALSLTLLQLGTRETLERKGSQRDLDHIIYHV
uniref:Uncharacterized protein n=1 Tax=Arion vulgaris TaxID=1028688 RepID=A0A0B6Z0M4_9EUPU